MKNIAIAIRRTALLMRATGLGDFPHQELAFWSLSPGHNGHGVEDDRSQWTDECWALAADMGGFGPDECPLDVCTVVREDIPDLRHALRKFISSHRGNARWAKEQASDLHNQAISDAEQFGDDYTEDYGDEVEATTAEGVESERLAALAEKVFSALEGIRQQGADL